MKRFKLMALTAVTALCLTATPVAAEETLSTNVVYSDVNYCTHIQNVGWQDWKTEGVFSGTHGQGLRLEGIKIELNYAEGADQSLVGIRYRTHVQNLGWQDWKYDGEMSGTEGLGYRLEAIQIELTGENADLYDVYYKVHAENFGYLDWAKNGEMSGTAGYGYRLEGINIEIVPKGSDPSTNFIDSMQSFYELSVDGPIESIFKGSDDDATPIDNTGSDGSPLFEDGNAN